MQRESFSQYIMSTKKNKAKTVSDKITEKFLPKPLADPENDPESLVKIADFDEDEDADSFAVTAKPSDIRKRNIKLLSEFSNKYKGKVTSRKEMEQDSEDSENGSELESNESEEDTYSSGSEDSELKRYKSKIKGLTIAGNKSITDTDETEDDDDNDQNGLDDGDIDDSELEKFKMKLKKLRINATENDSEPNENKYSENDNKDSDEDDSDSDPPEEIPISTRNGRRFPRNPISTHYKEPDSEDQDEEYEEEEDDSAEDEEIDDISNEDSEAKEDSDDLSSLDFELPNYLTQTNQNTEVQKGLAVQNQLKIWEKLLEIRIHSQKIANKANSLPPPATFNDFCDQDENFYKRAEETAANVEKLLENMLEIQYTLASQFSEMKNIFKESHKRPSSTDISHVEPPIKRFADTLSSHHESLIPYRDSVLKKWDDRVKILNPGSFGKKNIKSLLSDYDVIKKIEYSLLQKSDMLVKSQTVKGNYKLFGFKENENEEEITKDSEIKEEKKQTSKEIYDDNDFYHQQLRELIEYKSNTTANPAELNEQFAELQKLRTKMKKKVDTRASKGRKIRYLVHNKLVNFMAPQSNSEWTDESKTELYRSLFAT